MTRFANAPISFPPIPPIFSKIPPPPISPNGVQVHVCSVCLRPRSRQCQSEYPSKPKGSQSESGICRRCRVQDVTPSESRGMTNSAPSKGNTGKVDRVKQHETYRSDCQPSMKKEPVKGDAEMSEDARSSTPSSPGAEEIIRGIKVVRIPGNSKRKNLKKKRSGDQPIDQSRPNSNNKSTDPKQAPNSQARPQSGGRALAKQTRLAERSSSDEPEAEAKPSYDGVMEDLDITRDAAEEARSELRRCNRLSEDIRAFATSRAASMHPGEKASNVSECRYSYIVCNRMTCIPQSLNSESETSSWVV